jgi:hypothetical protein
MPKKKPDSTGSTLRRRAGVAASAGVRRAGDAARRARAWARERAPEPIPVSTMPATDAAAGAAAPSLIDTVEETVRRHPIETLLGAALAGYLLGRILR